MRPALIAVGGRAWAIGGRVMRDGTAVRKKRKGFGRREKEQMDTSNGIRCWKTGVWDRKEFPGIRVLGFWRILSSTSKKSFEKF